MSLARKLKTYDSFNITILNTMVDIFCLILLVFALKGHNFSFSEKYLYIENIFMIELFKG